VMEFVVIVQPTIGVGRVVFVFPGLHPGLLLFKPSGLVLGRILYIIIIILPQTI